ncbi:hypothetical protein QCA50_001896 [Cerrena zonata]|uniref:D-serine dehydratase n=1 Tax=Cerrena zonata TaxID=2478898 RepID=A0AAW0GM95_9APHY
MSGSPIQTSTPSKLMLTPDKDALLAEFQGKPIQGLRTPAAVIDRSIFAQNCARMHETAKQWDASFRAHVKTHKTAEGVRLQLASRSDATHAVVVSTLMEAWGIVDAGLVTEGVVKDILYGLPVAVNKVADLTALAEVLARSGASVRILIDNPEQIKFLEEFANKSGSTRKWSTFMKVRAGDKRAGLDPSSPEFRVLLELAIESPIIEVFGFYCHAGGSYSSTSQGEASKYLSSEVNAVNDAAGLGLSILEQDGKQQDKQHFILSVGSTPTAHAATVESRAKLNALLNGRLELHAGNYPLLDLQQLHTSMIDRSRIAQKVLATVVSYYPGRGADGTDEALCDAGAIAMSKDTGPSGSFGEVVGKTWKLGRVSQEHGILTRDGATTPADADKLDIGEVVQIVGQHACLTLAAYPWYYVVDSSDGSNPSVVADVWVPWKGW